MNLEWIRVRDRLPFEGNYILVCHAGCLPSVAYYSAGNERWEDMNGDEIGFSYWMSILKTPEVIF
jgi:hypothetical protein